MASATLVSRSRVHFGSHWNRAATNLALLVPAEHRLEPRSIPVPGLPRSLRVKLASTRSEWEQAFQLVADNYQARGFETAGFDYRFTSYHALPETIVLVALEGTQVMATLSLVPDNTLLGLPLENLYRMEVQKLRQHGRRLVETTCLADQSLSTREFVQVFLAFMQLGWQYWGARQYHTNVIAVNPRHCSFYTKALGYVPLGPRRTYAQVQGAPAEAFYLEPELMRLKTPEMHRRILGQRLPESVLRSAPLPAELVRHFARRSSQTTLATVEQLLRQRTRNAL